MVVQYLRLVKQDIFLVALAFFPFFFAAILRILQTFVPDTSLTYLSYLVSVSGSSSCFEFLWLTTIAAALHHR